LACSDIGNLADAAEARPVPTHPALAVSMPGLRILAPSLPFPG
jgi:hypothetical protein